MSQSIPAPLVWAQRKDQIFLSIDLQDVKDHKIAVESNKLTFSGTSGGKNYSCDLNFFAEIDPSKSKYVVRPRSVDFVLQKKESGPYWEHILKEKGKPRWLKVDWNKWKDEDDVDDEGFDMGGMSGLDMSQFGGNDDFANENDDDSDDEDIPNLEEEKKEEKKDENKEENKQ